MRNLPVIKFAYFAVFVAAIIFFLAIGRTALIDSRDFVPIYSGARCLVYGCNPYNTAQLEQQYLEGHGKPSELPRWRDEIPLYPPSTFVVLFPVAYLSYPAARILWLLLNECLFIAAVVAVIVLWGKEQWMAATVLGSFFLVTSAVYLVVGQPTVFSVSLLVIGTVLLFRNKALPLAALLLALSLAVKPQIGGLIVLYLLFRGVHRRYALIAAAVATAALLAGSFVLSSRPASTHWVADLRVNAAQSLQPGQVNDPAPSNFETLRMINLQVLTSVFLPQPGMYKAASYLIVAILFGIWAYGVARRPAELATHAFAIAGLSILTLLPVYHRAYDARLLLISVPAILILLKMRRRLGFVVIAVTVLSLVSFQFRTYLFLQQHPALQNLTTNRFVFALVLREQILMLLLLFLLYVVALLKVPAAAGGQLNPAESSYSQPSL